MPRVWAEEASAMPLKICYHGTSKENVVDILRDGFREGTYFARHLENAVHMGGPHVFGVAFDTAKFSHSIPHWQFILKEVVSPSRIVHYRVYQMREVACNERLGEEILQSNLARGSDYCDEDN